MLELRLPRALLALLAGAALACGGLGLCSPAVAFDFSGDKALVARFRDGGQRQLGRVRFTPLPALRRLVLLTLRFTAAGARPRGAAKPPLALSA